jgi:hypothetical protein
MNEAKSWCVSMLMILIMASESISAEAVFDFESQAVSTTVRAFAMTENGITALFLDPGTNSIIRDNNPSPGVPASWGQRHMFPAAFSTNHQFIDFSAKLTSLSLEFGDYITTSSNESDEVHLRAWSGLGGTGSVRDTEIVFYPGTSQLPGNVGIAAVASNLGFLSVEFWEVGSSNQNDVYIDNMTVTSVPEPPSIVGLACLFAMGFSAFGRGPRAIPHRVAEAIY